MIAFGAVMTTAMLSAQAVPEVKLVPSPPGQAAAQLGGRWEKTAEGGQRYVDGKWVVVDYSRPLLRGRTPIFGTGADYGKMVTGDAAIWRAGANDTTRLTTQAPLQIGDKTIAPGVYNVFVDLKAGQWTLVLNTQPVQPKFDPNDKVRLSGATNYDSKFDILRVPMTVGHARGLARAIHHRLRERDRQHRQADHGVGEDVGVGRTPARLGTK